jgi:hypothetical protein
LYALISLWQMPEEPEGRLQPLIGGSAASVIDSSPGVIEGYWTFEPSNGKSVGLVLLETASQAYDLRNALEHLMEERNEGGFELELIRVQEVVARLGSERRPAGRAGA